MQRSLLKYIPLRQLSHHLQNSSLRGLRFANYSSAKMSQTDEAYKLKGDVDEEKNIKRNPHPDFKKVEASRPPFEQLEWHLNRTVDPDWKPGSGANDHSWKDYRKVQIDPYGEGRAAGDNYKLLISAVTPRFIGFVSTISKDGKSTNLAPFSYTTMVNHDPPIMVIGFSGGMENKRDSLQNILDTGELVINVISEWFVEAANYTSVNAPLGVSEFAMSGLHQAPSTKVKAPHVAESAFSIEAKLVSHHMWHSPTSGKNTGVTIFAQGINFHIREDMWAKGHEGSIVDIGKLKPMSRLGGIMYGRTTGGIEIPRPAFEKETQKEEVKEVLAKGDKMGEAYE